MTEENKAARSAANEWAAGSEEAARSEAPRDDTGATTSNVTGLEQELEEARSKANTYLDLAQRTQADFVNYKRRVEQDRSDYARSARADIIQKLLGPLDDLDRAIESLPASLAGSDWTQGIKLIDRKFHSALESLGVRPLDVVGKPFDPYQEEAVAHEPSTTEPEGTVTRVVRPGYTLDGKVIRPAQVVISSGPPDSSGQ